MKCKHENAEHLMRGERIATMDGIVFVDPAQCEQFRCLDCRAWLSLGPSNDEPEEVRIEMLAAFLVNPGGFVRVAHKDYHDREWIDDEYNYAFRDDCVGCWAERLACEIAEPR